MQKISKSKTLDKDQEQRDKDFLNNMPTSPHFTVGTWIMRAPYRRGEILDVFTCKCDRAEKSLRIRWEDDTISVIRPHALNPNGVGH